MTLAELKAYILAQLVAPVNVVQKVINCFNAVIDYFTGNTISSIIPDWTNALTFQTDGTDAGKFCIFPDTDGKPRIWQTLVDDNINNSPPSNPLTTSNAYWNEVSQAGSSAIVEWEAKLYGAGLVIVFWDHSTDGPGLYKLNEPTRPFSSTNIESEITAGTWVQITGSPSSSGGPAIDEKYANVAALLADQANQDEDALYFVLDATTDSTVDLGWALYQKLTATTGALTDYRKLSEEESLDVIFSGTNASETVKGIVEEATDAETVAGTATGATGAKLFVSPAKLKPVVDLKNDALITTRSIAGAHTLDGTDLTSINTGKKLIIEGDSTDDITIPANATQAFPIGTALVIKGFENLIEAVGVTVTPSSGVLTGLDPDATALLIKTGTNTWSLEVDDVSTGGTSYWPSVPGTPTRTSNTVFTITDTGNANLYNLLISKTTVLKWTDSGNTKMAMVVSATYAADVVTVTIMGDTLAVGFTAMKYSIEKCRPVPFAIAGNIGVGTNLSRIFKAYCPLKVFGADGYHRVAGTTNATTYDLNKNGTTFMTTKVSIASGATVGNGYSADDGTTLAMDDVVSLDCDSVSTTAPIDIYIDLFVFPLYNQYLS
jgi:hypothetical protein